MDFQQTNTFVTKQNIDISQPVKVLFQPDRPFHNFRASKSIDRQFFAVRKLPPSDFEAAGCDDDFRQLFSHIIMCVIMTTALKYIPVSP